MTPDQIVAKVMESVEQQREYWSGDIPTCHCSACSCALEVVQRTVAQAVVEVLSNDTPCGIDGHEDCERDCYEFMNVVDQCSRCRALDAWRALAEQEGGEMNFLNTEDARRMDQIAVLIAERDEARAECNAWKEATLKARALTKTRTEQADALAEALKYAVTLLRDLPHQRAMDTEWCRDVVVLATDALAIYDKERSTR